MSDVAIPKHLPPAVRPEDYEENLSLADEFANTGTVKHFALRLGFMPDDEKNAEEILTRILQEHAWLEQQLENLQDEKKLFTEFDIEVTIDQKECYEKNEDRYLYTMRSAKDNSPVSLQVRNREHFQIQACLERPGIQFPVAFRFKYDGKELTLSPRDSAKDGVTLP